MITNEFDNLMSEFKSLGGKVKITKKYVEYRIGNIRKRAIRYPASVLEYVLKDYKLTKEKGLKR